jgi:hypothetical protein
MLQAAPVKRSGFLFCGKLPELKAQKQIGDIDQVAAFFVFAQYAGDVERTAFALSLPAEAVFSVASANGWAEKLKRSTASNSGGQSAEQRSVNRIVNYVQAHRLRAMVDALVSEFTDEPEKLKELVEVHTKGGSYVDMSPVLNLVKAAETAQNMTYRALGDSMEQSKADERPDAGGKDLSKAVWQAMDVADRTPGTSSVDLVRSIVAKELPTKCLPGT